jgi:hypothetical protein
MTGLVDIRPDLWNLVDHNAYPGTIEWIPTVRVA